MWTHIEYIYTGSVEDCDISTDVRLRSQAADGTIFGAHQQNLEFFSEGFPIANSMVADEVLVQLQKNADVL